MIMLMDLDSRIFVYNKYNKIFKKINHDYFVKDSVIGEGYQGKVYKYCKKECQIESIAVKKMYISKKLSKYVDNYLNKDALKYCVYIELAASQLTNQILLQKISPNFVFNYSSSFNERSGICNDRYPYASYYYNEFIDNSDTFDNWVYEKKSTIEWYNVYFQIIINIYILQKYFNMTHLDLHAQNILVKNVKKGGHWEYIIDNKSYMLPNLGYQIFIIDFGQAWIPNILKPNLKKKSIKESDLKQLFNSTLDFSKSSKSFKVEIKNIIKRLKDESFSTIIHEIWYKKYGNIESNNIIESYNTDKILKVDMLPSIFKKFLTKYLKLKKSKQ